MKISAFWIVLFLYDWVLKVKPAACPNANFPLVLNGRKDVTRINSFDYKGKFVLGGFTKCTDLKGSNGGNSDPLPLIALYSNNAAQQLVIQWGITLAIPGHAVSAIKFSNDGKNIVSLIEKFTRKSYICFIRVSGRKWTIQKITSHYIETSNL